MRGRIRDGILFFGGLVGLGVLTYAWLINGRQPDASLLLIFGAMMGLPAFLRADERDE